LRTNGDIADGDDERCDECGSDGSDAERLGESSRRFDERLLRMGDDDQLRVDDLHPKCGVGYDVCPIQRQSGKSCLCNDLSLPRRRVEHRRYRFRRRSELYDQLMPCDIADSDDERCDECGSDGSDAERLGESSWQLDECLLRMGDNDQLRVDDLHPKCGVGNDVRPI